MTCKTMFRHELTYFRQSRRPARESWLAGDYAHRLVCATDSLDLPVEGKLLVDESNAFQIILLCGKTGRPKLPSELATVRSLDHPHASIRKPDLMLRATRLAKTLRQNHLLQLLRHRRFQNGSADAESRPADSNSRICASQSARFKGFWFWRYSATRLRSVARACSMVSAPMDMNRAYPSLSFSQ